MASTISEFFESRLPVGSSARTMAGLLIKRPGQRHPLLLAPGKFGRPVRQALLQSQQAYDLVEVCGIANAVGAGNIKRDINIRLRAQRRQQIEFLEDESDLALAQPGALGVGELREVVAVDDDVPGIGASQSTQQVEKGGFAAARGAYDTDKFSLLHVKGDTPERGNVNFAHAVGLAQFDGFDEGRHPTD